MNKIFHGPIAAELSAFLQFKRSLGYGYRRAEFALREFDQFLSRYARKDSRWQLDRAAIAWFIFEAPAPKAAAAPAVNRRP